MTDHEKQHAKILELTGRSWDLEAIEERFAKLMKEGIPSKTLDHDEIIREKAAVLSRVQTRGEEYEYLSRNCAKGSALAVMEEFGLGNMEIIKALSPFPGFGMTGEICGGVTGGLIALGLFFGSDDPLNYEGTGRTITAAREFIPRFKQTLGTIMCPEIQEKVIFGRYMDPRASKENYDAFVKERAHAKCALPTGIGARIAAEIIIESLEGE